MSLSDSLTLDEPNSASQGSVSADTSLKKRRRA